MTGKELKKIRRQFGMTQTEFAELIGTTRNTVARWERDEMGIREPTAKLIKILSRDRSKKGGETQ